MNYYMIVYGLHLHISQPCSSFSKPFGQYILQIGGHSYI